MEYKIIFTSDIHGNKVQYEKLMNHAIKISANSIIIGGDIAPKGFSREEYILNQRKFFEEDFQKIMKKLKEKLSNCEVYLMMGNDDCDCNLSVLKKGEPNLYKIIHGKRIKLDNDFEIIGYSFVPITPFGIKDWEKYDFSKTPQKFKEKYFKRKQINYRLNGERSSKNRWKLFNFTPEIEKTDSIQNDLSKKLFTRNSKKTIYVLHSPPDDTNLDQMGGRVHVGSFAIRDFIEKHKPYLTLHGHIHETVDVSKKFKDKIGETYCFASGNHNISESLAMLVFDLYDIQNAERIII